MITDDVRVRKEVKDHVVHAVAMTPHGESEPIYLMVALDDNDNIVIAIDDSAIRPILEEYDGTIFTRPPALITLTNAPYLVYDSNSFTFMPMDDEQHLITRI